jgi:hypothetical protein
MADSPQDANDDATVPSDSQQPSGDGQPCDHRPIDSLPFSGWWPLLAGALSGIILRLVYSGSPGGVYAAMMWPCMGIICRATNWPRQALYGVSALPLLLGAWETQAPLPQRIAAVERAIVIQVQPAVIWQQILNARNIKPDEVHSAWLFRIGVPVPMAGITEQTPDGPVRKVTMGKNIHFEQVLTARLEHRYLHWKYRFRQASFPPYALDEHVVLGGHYFDITDTSYTLTPQGDRTELKVRMQYRVSTQFNWYADPVARFLLGNLGEVNLDYYRHRSERPQHEVK